MRLWPPIFANILLTVAAFGSGSVLIGFFPVFLRGVDRLAAILLTGLGCLATVLFLVGLVHFSLAAILAVLVPAGLLGIWYFLREAKHGLFPSSPPRFPPIPALVIAIVLLITFVAGLAEPVSDLTSWDSIAYHYLGPRVWVRDAIIHPVPDESYTSFPANVETLYAALLAIGGSRAMPLFAVSSLGLLLLVTYGFALCLELDSRGAWWTAALVASMPAVYRGCYGGYIDGTLVCFVLLSFRIAVEAGGTRDFALSGLFSGLAMGTKYHGIIAFLLILACAFLFHLLSRRENLSVILKHLAILGGVAAAVASPWYLRNWIVLGSPIYPPTPALSHFFPVKYMPPDAIANIVAAFDRSDRGMGRDLTSFLLLPFRLTFHPANYINGAGGVGLALLTLAPFGILVCWYRPFAKVTALFMFFFTVAWFLTAQDVRYILSVIVILAAFAIWGWQFVAKRAPRLGPFLARLSIGVSILYGLTMIASARASDARATASSSYEELRKHQDIPYFESFAKLNQDPTVKKVLVLDPLVPTYYLEKDYIKPVGRFGERSLPEGVESPEILSDLPKLAVTHVLDVKNEEHGFRVLSQRPDLTLVLDLEGQRIYRVMSVN